MINGELVGVRTDEESRICQLLSDAVEKSELCEINRAALRGGINMIRSEDFASCSIASQKKALIDKGLSFKQALEIWEAEDRQASVARREGIKKQNQSHLHLINEDVARRKNSWGWTRRVYFWITRICAKLRHRLFTR